MCIARTKAQGPEANSEENICLKSKKTNIIKDQRSAASNFFSRYPNSSALGAPVESSAPVQVLSQCFSVRSVHQKGESKLFVAAAMMQNW